MVVVNFFEKISISICLLLVALLSIDGCSHKLSDSNLQANSVQMDGGQDSGGGSAFKSTAEQVNGALDEALKLIAEPDPNKNIFVQFWLDKGRTNKHIFIQKPLHVFPKFDSGSSIRFMSPEFKAVSKNKLVRLTSGDCLNTATEVNKDASVSAHNLHAELCFSIGNLARIPPSSLLREVLSLVLHEATHMGGADEREAIAWQREFSNYFGARFGNLSDDEIIESTLEKLSDAKANLTTAQKLARKNPKNPLIYEAMGRMASILGSLPDISDPLALELKLAPSSAGEIDNYMNSAQGLLDFIKVGFEQGEQDIKVHGLDFRFGSVPPDKMEFVLFEIQDYLEQVKGNFLAMTEFSPSVHSRCLFPRTDSIGAVTMGLGSASDPSFGSIARCNDENDF